MFQLKRINLILISILFIISCQPTDTVKSITIESKYSLTIPSFLNKTNILNENASLQYFHPLKEFYVIVIDESKSEFHQGIEEFNLANVYQSNFDGFTDLVLDNYKESISISNQLTIIDTIVNGIPAKITSFKGNVDGIDIFYDLGIYEGKTSYYQVLTWTLFSRKVKNIKAMNKILYSLSEPNTQ